MQGIRDGDGDEEEEKEEEEVGGRGPSGDSRPFPTGFGEAQFPRH